MVFIAISNTVLRIITNTQYFLSGWMDGAVD